MTQMIANQIRYLREQRGLTQADLAKKLGLTRSSVNAWEMGVSVPSVQYVIELAKIFQVSTDYILGVNSSWSISLSGLSDADVQMVCTIVNLLRSKHEGED